MPTSQSVAGTVTPVVLDSCSRTLHCGARRSQLQEKTWQVLQLLIDNDGTTRSRSELIDAVWSGDFRTGEKGLNQAIWTLRQALRDDARAPHFIRTVPRVGYRWIAGPVRVRAASRCRPVSHAWAASLAVAAVGAALVGLTGGAIKAPAQWFAAASISVAEDGTRAYLRDRDIVVDMPEGCQRIVRADESSVRFGAPLVSADGQRIMFRVHRASECKVVALQLTDGTRTDYGRCPVS